MRDSAIALLKKLTEAHSVSGFEGEVRHIFRSELNALAPIHSDGIGNSYASFDGSGPLLGITAHMDEIGFWVQNITYDGFIQFVPAGGWWSHSLLSQRVEILTRSGQKILGVVCSRPPHFMSAEARQRVQEIDSLFIDVGANSRSDAEQNFGIHLNDPIAPVSEFTAMHRQDFFMAKAFDNRVGVAGMIQATQLLASQSRQNRLTALATVQEEIGLRGAKVAAASPHFQPDCLLVLEGPPADDTPGFPIADSQGRLGGGVQIRLSDPTALMNPTLTEWVIETAKAKQIPHQVTVRRSGGTDAGAFHLAAEGRPCIVLGTPARYIHSHNAIIDLQDYLAMVELCVELGSQFNQEIANRISSF